MPQLIKIIYVSMACRPYPHNGFEGASKCFNLTGQIIVFCIIVFNCVLCQSCRYDDHTMFFLCCMKKQSVGIVWHWPRWFQGRSRAGNVDSKKEWSMIGPGRTNRQKGKYSISFFKKLPRIGNHGLKVGRIGGRVRCALFCFATSKNTKH